MIHSVRCDQPKYKNVEFKPGFNVVLAVRTEEATDKDSRNGVGKTTLLEIIHFCLGSGFSGSSRLSSERLRGWTFSLDVDLRGRRYTIHRNTADPKRVLLEGNFESLPFEPKHDRESGLMSMSLSQWNAALGWFLFDYPPDATDQPYSPSFRSLISYFVRRGRDAFSTPFEHFRKQQEWDKQVNNSFLLGLWWEYPSKMQQLKDREKMIKQLTAAAKSGEFPELFGSIGEMETIKVQFEERIARTGEQLRTFRVHPQYLDIQDRADALQAEIRRLNSENVIDQAMSTFYKESFAEEEPVDNRKVAKIYEEAGVALPNQVVKRLNDVQEFHVKLIANRRNFLQAELSRLGSAIAVRTEKIRAESEKRAELLKVLQTHGALAEYAELQGLHSEDQGRLEQVKNRIELVKRVEEGRSALRIEREQLQLLARADYSERRTTRERAISLFNAYSEALYNRPGRLVIDVGQTGFKFAVEIERQDSQGVEQMKVFCYDLTLATIWYQRVTNPGFLIHDSMIFADVDERQKAHALELAARVSLENGFQYICCLNSDTIPQGDFSPDFSIEPYVRLELTDATEDGGLLGIRF